jgi:hypothetical protein
MSSLDEHATHSMGLGLTSGNAAIVLHGSTLEFRGRSLRDALCRRAR